MITAGMLLLSLAGVVLLAARFAPTGEKRWGPFNFVAGPAGNHRLIPKVGLNRITGSNVEGSWLAGVWLSWLGRQAAVTRNRWWDREATWRNQAACGWHHLLRRAGLERPPVVRPGTDRTRPGGHQPITVVTRAELTGATAAEAEVRILDSHVKCIRCGLVLKGAKWIDR